MSNNKQLANPLQSLLSRVARATPRETGETSKYKSRLDSAGEGVVILADYSSSMDEPAGKCTKIAVLRDALGDVLPGLVSPRLVAFGSTARLVANPAQIPEPSGGTSLHLALDLATSLRPARTLVLSDGQPDDETAALAAAERLGGRIDCIFCGPDSDAAGRDFLARLARLGCGTFVRCDLAKTLSTGLAIEARRVLGLPALRRY